MEEGKRLGCTMYKARMGRKSEAIESGTRLFLESRTFERESLSAARACSSGWGGMKTRYSGEILAPYGMGPGWACSLCSVVLPPLVQSIPLDLD